MQPMIDLSRRLADQVAIVTGGARGIGRAIATRLAAEGASVAVLDVNERGVQDTAAALTAEGRSVIGLACNVTQRQQVREAIAAVVTKFGRLSVLINNAGIVRRCHFLELTDAVWDEVLGVNLTGTFIVAQEAARIMVQQGSGRIINMASVAAEIAHGNQTAYSVSKAGIATMTRNMAFDLAPFGIAVNAIAPGTIATDFALGALSEDARARRLQRIPIGRFGDTTDVAAVAAFLASADAAYLTGSIVTVDGGLVIGGVRDAPAPAGFGLQTSE
jgi:NAD(P)-dependent dehydrogenase (short-subunit alcohol dehydrogenase family)